MVQDARPIIVSNNVSAGGRGDRDKNAILKIPKIKVDPGTILTLGALAAVIGVGYVAYTMAPDFITSLFPTHAESGAAVSGAGVAASGPGIVTTAPQLPYPGGTGTFPAPSLTQPPVPGQYPYTTQPYPLPVGQTPYVTSPIPYGGGYTPLPISPLGNSVVQSFHAQISDKHYFDHKGKRRKFIGETHLTEMIGSEDEGFYKVDD